MFSKKCDCEEKVRKFREDLLREIDYPHWGPSELYALKKALKWFNQVFGAPE
jgi:hypothetical protein